MNTMLRRKTVATFTISPEVIERLEKWLASFELSPSKSAVVEKALIEYLDRKELPARSARKSAVVEKALIKYLDRKESGGS